MKRPTTFGWSRVVVVGGGSGGDVMVVVLVVVDDGVDGATQSPRGFAQVGAHGRSTTRRAIAAR